MTQAHKIITFALIAVLLIGGIWFLNRNQDTYFKEDQNNVQATSTEATSTLSKATSTSKTTSSSKTGSGGVRLETYTNGTYKFTLSYPSDLQAQPFSNFYELNNNDWRVKASSAKRGTPVISIPVFRIDQGSIATGKKYPLFFDAEVRVGISNDTAQCYSPDDGYTNQKINSVVIGGVTFKKFDFADAAMMKYVSGSSYRTIYNSKCYVIEQVEQGSTYKDDTMLPGYTQKELDAIYNKTTPIVYSFRFIK